MIMLSPVFHKVPLATRPTIPHFSVVARLSKLTDHEGLLCIICNLTQRK